MALWQDDILRRYGSQEGQGQNPVQAEIDRFASQVERLAQMGDAANTRRMKLREPCLPCLRNRR